MKIIGYIVQLLTVLGLIYITVVVIQDRNKNNITMRELKDRNIELEYQIEEQSFLFERFFYEKDQEENEVKIIVDEINRKLGILLSDTVYDTNCQTENNDE